MGGLKELAWQTYADGRGVPGRELVFGEVGELEGWQQFFLYLTQVKTVDKADGEVKFYPVGWRYLRKLGIEALYNRQVDILKARQMLVTITFAALADWWCRRHGNNRVIIISRRAQESEEFLKRFMDPIDGMLPAAWKGKKVGIFRRVKSEREYGNGSLVSSYPPRSTSGRSITGNLAICDEAGFYDNLEEVTGGLQPVLDTHGTLLVSSTPKKMTQGFYARIQEDEEGEGTRLLVKIPWHRRPDRDEAWAAAMKGTMSEQDWLSEYCLQFLGIVGGVVFDNFNGRIHIVDEAPGEFKRVSEAGREMATPVYCAIDPHITKPWAILWVAMLPGDVFYVFQELWSKLVTPLLAERIRAMEVDLRVVDRVIDPFGSMSSRQSKWQSAIEQLGAQGLSYRQANRDRSGFVRLRDGMEIAADGKPRFYIHSSCKKTIEHIRQFSGQTDAEVANSKKFHFVHCMKYVMNANPRHWTTEPADTDVRKLYDRNLRAMLNEDAGATMGRDVGGDWWNRRG